METRARKKRRVTNVSSQDDFVDLENSQSDDVMCSQFVDDDVYHDKSSSDVELLSEVCFFSFFFLFCLYY